MQKSTRSRPSPEEKRIDGRRRAVHVFLGWLDRTPEVSLFEKPETEGTARGRRRRKEKHEPSSDVSDLEQARGWWTPLMR